MTELKTFDSRSWMRFEWFTKVCGSVQLLLSGSNSWTSLFHPQKMSSAWWEKTNTDMNLFWLALHLWGASQWIQTSSTMKLFWLLISLHIHQSRWFCRESDTHYANTAESVLTYSTACTGEFRCRNINLPSWTQQESLSRGDGSDPDRGVTLLQLNLSSCRLTE